MNKLDRLDELIDGAEGLLTQLADAHDPNIQWLRDRVDQGVAAQIGEFGEFFLASQVGVAVGITAWAT